MPSTVVSVCPSDVVPTWIVEVPPPDAGGAVVVPFEQAASAIAMITAAIEVVRRIAISFVSWR